MRDIGAFTFGAGEIGFTLKDEASPTDITATLIREMPGNTWRLKQEPAGPWIRVNTNDSDKPVDWTSDFDQKHALVYARALRRIFELSNAANNGRFHEEWEGTFQEF